MEDIQKHHFTSILVLSRNYIMAIIQQHGFCGLIAWQQKWSQ
jgi:hypothetical protein